MLREANRKWTLSYSGLPEAPWGISMFLVGSSEWQVFSTAGPTLRLQAQARAWEGKNWGVSGQAQPLCPLPPWL